MGEIEHFEFSAPSDEWHWAKEHDGEYGYQSEPSWVGPASDEAKDARLCREEPLDDIPGPGSVQTNLTKGQVSFHHHVRLVAANGGKVAAGWNLVTQMSPVWDWITFVVLAHGPEVIVNLNKGDRIWHNVDPWIKQKGESKYQVLGAD